MMDDLLSRATRAIQSSPVEDDADAGSTRARVMASLHRSRVRRRTRVAVLLPIAATFATATALGASGGHVIGWVRSVWEGWHEAGSPALPAVRERTTIGSRVWGRGASAADAKGRPSVAPAGSATAPPAENTPPESTLGPPLSNGETAQDRGALPDEAARTHERAAPVTGAAPLVVKAASAAGRRRPLANGDAPPTEAAAPSASREASRDAEPALAFDLYRAAHHAHFVERDPSAALAAWDAYLEAAPHGRFELEARYNRALCLFRLGGAAEARAALLPFARGEFGEYRRTEAASLIERLDARGAREAAPPIIHP